MDFSKFIAKKDEYAQYMVDEITHICTKFEKRGPGSRGEQQACEYAAEQMKEYGCDRVYVEEFKENPGSFFGWINFTITFCFLAFISYFFVPALSLAFIFLGLAICVLQFGFYKKIVDKFFKEKIGHNATGFKKPTGEVKRRIIFNGHPDAAWEWPFKYKFTYLGFDIHMMLCFLGAFYMIGISIAKLAGINDALALKLGLGALAFVPFWFGLYFMWNRNKIVDGANDNLSGCYIGMAILKALHDEGIEFENKLIPTEITLQGVKYLDGKTSDGFRFVLKRDGEIFRTAKNLEDGRFDFGSISFAEVGKYKFTVSEISNPLVDNTIFDKSEFDVTVDVTELMGAEIYLYLNIGETRLIAKVSARSQSRGGDKIKVALDMTRLHIFDKDTERCVMHLQ